MLIRIKYAVLILIAFIAVISAAYAEEPNTPKAVKPLTVNELAANPAAHFGRVSVVGVVGTVNPGKGFMLVDSREFKNCGLSCLTEPGTNKIPFIWTEVAPQVEQTVQVDGLLEKTTKGFSIKAEKVTKQ
jgi:hypothetical protein